ncbi:hypothetical protein AeRB84_004095 [Aphanomyces euteiches]|nr:hypothetical protein AeRB84_004095 [Aphanomyces euteiches]
MCMELMAYHFVAHVHKLPKRVSILTGALWVDEILSGNAQNVVEAFRMPKHTFRALVRSIIEEGGLERGRDVSVEEQLAIFMYFVGKNASSRCLQCRFQHSGETITRHLRYVLKALRTMCPKYIKLPPSGSPVSLKIRGNPKFYQCFDRCRMAIDGTHIPVSVPAHNVARFQSRKGITVNVLAACDFDLMFTYVLAGWEGTAGDGKLYEHARRFGLDTSGDFYDILDAGFALTNKALTPYRGTRYHLKEFARGTRRPQTKVFNLRHAQLRNAIERIFGILKKRFPVLCHPVEYDYQFQVDLVLVLCVLHNFIRMHGGFDEFDQQVQAELDQQNLQPMSPEDRPSENAEPESNEAKIWRDSIAEAMSCQYNETLQVLRRRQR